MNRSTSYALLLLSLGSTTAKTHIVPLPFGKAKKKLLAGQEGLITYAAKVYFTRINTPAFPVEKGYLIQSCLGPFCVDAQPEALTTLAKDLQIPNDIGTQTIVPFDILWTYTKGKEGGVAFSLFIENDVTTNALKPKPGTVLICAIRPKRRSLYRLLSRHPSSSRRLIRLYHAMYQPLG